MAGQVTVHGTVAPGFEPVREAFAANFRERGEVGAAVAAFLDGEPVVDLWAGFADKASSRPWEEETMTVMFSATKGLVAVALAMLVDRGELDLDKPVAWYWPEFGRGGKRDITVRTLINHRSGLSALDEPLPLMDLHDRKRVESVLVKQEPLWPPGSAQGYGACSWGLYTDALFYRLTDETVGSWLWREVFEPLGGDLYLGLPAEENRRTATLYPTDLPLIARRVLPEMVRAQTLEGRLYRKVLLDKTSVPRRALGNPQLGPKRLGILNEPEVRAMELAWMGAIGTARAVAKVYSVLAQGGTGHGVSLLSEKHIDGLKRRESWTYEDRTLLKPMGYTQGFIKEEPHLISPNEAHFGHTGAGGTVGFADPTHRLGMAYLMNKMDHHVRSPRCIALCRAMYACLQDV